MPRASMSRLTARACLSGAVAASLADVIGGSALAAARALVPPAVHQTSNGDPIAEERLFGRGWQLKRRRGRIVGCTPRS